MKDNTTRPHFLNQLWTLVSECEACTGENFSEFIMPLVNDHPQDFELMQRIRKLQD